MKAKPRLIIAGILCIGIVLACLGLRSSPPLPHDYDFPRLFPHRGALKAWEVGREEILYEFQAPEPEVRAAIRKELLAKGWTMSSRKEWHKEGMPLADVDEFRLGDNGALFLPFTNTFRPPPGTTCEIIFINEPTWFQDKATPIRGLFKRIWPFGPRLPKSPDMPISHALP